jgi:hypothetical protein
MNFLSAGLTGNLQRHSRMQNRLDLPLSRIRANSACSNAGGSTVASGRAPPGFGREFQLPAFQSL